jgi:hypothetical protein
MKTNELSMSRSEDINSRKEKIKSTTLTFLYTLASWQIQNKLTFIGQMEGLS